VAERELWYGQLGPILYDDAYAGEYSIAEGKWIYWYPAPYTTYPLRAALFSQAYCTDVPVSDIELIRRMDVDGTANTVLKADATTKLPVDSAIVENGTNVVVAERNIIPSVTQSKTLGTALLAWLEAHVGEIQLVPKAASTGPEGTMFYASDDDHVYVATE